ncbi:MAG TPA: hypothetical protein VNV37_04215 [Solirubrobacteraceae bacterium]|nr:hypothetical protein [Solirubrobacteraceae bacterium]
MSGAAPTGPLPGAPRCARASLSAGFAARPRAGAFVFAIPPFGGTAPGAIAVSRASRRLAGCTMWRFAATRFELAGFALAHFSLACLATTRLHGA